MDGGIMGICRRPLKKFQQPKQSEKGPRWVKDKAVFWCKLCNTDFSVVVRKHHCRHCGHVFCGHCCSNKRTLIKYGYLKPVRLCNKCNASCFKADLLLNAVGLNDITTVTKICEEGCDVHFTTTVFPALTIAANRGSSDMVRVLLRFGADPNHAVPATDSGTVVQCSRCGRTQAAGNLKDNQYECSYCGNYTRHADASDSDHTGITALHAAVQKEGHLDVVVALLEHGADVDCTTAKGNTALMYAAAGGHVECANVVLEYGANANVRSEADSDTPMHKAVREGHMPLVTLLIKHRADLSLQNIAGLTAQQLAERCKRPEIAALLADVVKNGYPEPAVAPTKVPAPLLLNLSAGGKAGAALTGGKTFEELMNIKAEDVMKPDDPVAPAPNTFPVASAPAADNKQGMEEEAPRERAPTHTTVKMGAASRLQAFADEDEDEDEPLNLAQGKDEERDAEKRAEELLARLELQDASPPPLPRSPPADVSTLGALEMPSEPADHKKDAQAEPVEEAGDGVEKESSEAGADETDKAVDDDEGAEGAEGEGGSKTDGLVFKGKGKKGGKKKK